MRVVIMAGGGGTRLWPVSRAAHPKQFHRLTSNHSLLQETVLRVRSLVGSENIYITTGKAFVNEINFQLLDIDQTHVLVEPDKRDNAAAVGLAVVRLLFDNKGHDDTMVMLPADHIILKPENFSNAIQAADAFLKAHPENIVTIGVRPTYPETGYGYIKMDVKQSELVNNHEVFRVDQFVEKPDLKTAEKFVQDYAYLWNAGIFVFRLKTMWQLYQQLLPEIASGLETIAATFGSDNEKSALEEIYPTLPATSIDYGIMEKAKDVAVIPCAELGWSDVGNWQSLRDSLPKDQDGNVIFGEHIGIDTKNTFVHGEKRLIATIGLKDIVIVDTDDALLIADASRVAEVKKVIELLKDDRREDLL